MTKIDQLSPQHPENLPGGRKTQTAPRDASFKDALQKAAAQPSEVGQTQPVAQYETPSAIQPTATPSAPSSLGQAQLAGVEAGEKALFSLDLYQKALADGGQSLKDLAPLVHDLEQETKNLLAAIKELDPGDALHGVLSELAATTEAETIKFNRGDFIPAAPVEA